MVEDLPSVIAETIDLVEMDIVSRSIESSEMIRLYLEIKEKAEQFHRWGRERILSNR